MTNLPDGVTFNDVTTGPEVCDRCFTADPYPSINLDDQVVCFECLKGSDLPAEQRIARALELLLKGGSVQEVGNILGGWS